MVLAVYKMKTVTQIYLCKILIWKIAFVGASIFVNINYQINKFTYLVFILYNLKNKSIQKYDWKVVFINLNTNYTLNKSLLKLFVSFDKIWEEN